MSEPVSQSEQAAGLLRCALALLDEDGQFCAAALVAQALAIVDPEGQLVVGR